MPSTLILARVGGGFAVVLVAALPLIRFGGWEIDDTDIGLIRAPWQLAQTLGSAWNPNGFGFDQTRSQALLFPVNATFTLMHLLRVPAGDETQLWLGLLLATAGTGMWWFLNGWFARPSTWNVTVVITAAMGYMLSSFVIVIATDTTMFLLPYATLPWLLGITFRAAAGRMRPLRRRGPIGTYPVRYLGPGPPASADQRDCHCDFRVGCRRPDGPAAPSHGGCRRCGSRGCCAHVDLGPDGVERTRGSKPGHRSLSAESAAMYDAHTSAAEVARLQGYWALYSGYADRPYRPYQSYYLDSFVGTRVGYLLVALAVIGAFARRRQRVAIVLAVLALVSWRLVIGVYPVPFPPGSPSFFRWAFAHIPLASTFRDTFKFMTVLTLTVLALAAASIVVWEGSERQRQGRHTKQATRWPVRTVGLCVLVFAVVGTAEPVWGGQLWWPDKGTQLMPASWQNVASWLNAQPEPPSERVLLLPDMPFPVYDWGVPPTEPAATLVHRWEVFQVPGTQSVYGEMEIRSLFQALQAVPHRGGTEFVRLLAAARIRFLLVRGDMQIGYYPGIPSAEQTEQWLGKVAGVQRVAVFGPLVVYRVNDPLAPLVACTGITTSRCANKVVSSGGGTSYQVSLRGIGDHRVVSLDEAYEAGWQAVGTAGIRRVALPHVVVNNFANGWQVPGWVRQVTLVYEPVKVLAPARLLSAIAVVVVLVLLATDLRRSRRRSAFLPPGPRKRSKRWTEERSGCTARPTTRERMMADR